MADSPQTRMQRLGPPAAPADEPEPEQLVLAEYVSSGRIAVITLNRPHADNAVTTELAAQLIEVLETIAARPSVRVAILTGAGIRAFSVGGDLYERKEMTKEERLAPAPGLRSRALQLARAACAGRSSPPSMGRPTAAVARWPSAPTSSSPPKPACFGQPEAMVGLSAGGGSPVFLPRFLPPGMAMQMLMTGEPITAQEAHRLGMVNSVHPRDES